MRFITLNEQNQVNRVRYGSTIVKGEIQSDVGEIGQIQQQDGSFIDALVEPTEQLPSLQEVQAQILLNTEYLVVMSELTTI